MSKIYPHDEAKIAANSATAGERENWNATIQESKERRVRMNRLTFVPRKLSRQAI